MTEKRTRPGTGTQAALVRRKAFAQAYIANGRNGMRAAITAGFSAKGATVRACKLLKEPKMAALIAEMTARAEAATGLTTENVLREIRRLAFSDLGRMYRADGTLIPVQEMDDDVRAAVASVEVDAISGEDAPSGTTTKLKVWDKPRALEMAMKHLGLYERDNSQRGESLAIQIVLVK